MNPLVYFLLFFKATIFSKSSVGNVAGLHQELLGRGWARNANFGEAIAIGQLGTGSNALWAVCLGFLTYGWSGALLALLAITLPHLLILPLASIYQHFEQQTWAQALLRSLLLVSVGFLFSAAWTIFESVARPGDWVSLVICLMACLLCLSRRVGSFPVLLAAAGVGYLCYH